MPFIGYSQVNLGTGFFGKVGINVGSTSPTERLKVNGTSAFIGLGTFSGGLTATGTVSLPSTTSIGSVSGTEISYLDGVTSAVQTQLNAKLSTATAASTYLPLIGGTLTGDLNVVSANIRVNNALKIASPIDDNYEARLEQEDDRFSISNYYNGTGMGAAPDYLNVFTVVGDKVGVNTSFPNTDFHVSGGAKIENNLELNDIPDVRAAINAKLSTTTAASTYAPINNATLTGSVQLPMTTSIGSLTYAELSLLDGATGTTGTTSSNIVFSGSPTLVTPNLGTPSAATLTNATGLPVSTGISGLGSGVATFLATPSSANLATAITDETGTGSVVLNTSPTFVTNITTPKIIGGTGTTSSLVLQPTTGVGTTGADVVVNVGNNGATEALRIMNSGNVGVGISATSSKFHVYGTGYVEANIQTTATNAGAFFKFTTGSRTYSMGGRSDYVAGAFHIVDENAATPRITLLSDGKTGIGTISPSGILHIASTTSFAVLCPMTQTQRNALSGLVAGAEIYCSDCIATDSSTGVKQIYNGSTWKNCW